MKKFLDLEGLSYLYDKMKSLFVSDVKEINGQVTVTKGSSNNSFDIVKTVNGQSPINGNVEIDIPNIPANADYIVERAGYNSLWYEVYKSGKVVQGGVLQYSGTTNYTGTVIFLKPFSTNNYSFYFGLDGVSGTPGAAYIQNGENRTTGFTVRIITAGNNYQGRKLFWKCEEQI